MGRPNAIRLFDAAFDRTGPIMPPIHNATTKDKSRLSSKSVALHEGRFVTFPGMPYRRRSVLVCAAIGSDGVRCEERSYEGRWCGRHKEQRMKLHSNFKACRTAIENFSRDDSEHDAARVGTLEAPRAKRLRDMLKTKRRLLRGCLDARECFWTRFYGDDMDFGNDAYGHSLKKRFKEVQTLLHATEKRLHELLLSDMGALWILSEISPPGHVPRSLESCCEDPEVMLEKAQLLPPPASQKLAAATITTDPVLDALKQKKYAIIIGVWDYIAKLCTPPESQFFPERLAIIYAHIARCIASDATLFLVARKYPSVEDFLQDLEQDIFVWEKLMDVLSQPNVHFVRAAIEDVLHPADDDAEYVTFLGGRLYRELSDASFLPFRAWSHWAVFFPSSCFCAVQKGFSTAGAISLFSKFMQLHGVFPSSQCFKPIRSNLKILNLCGIHLGPFDPVGVRHSIQKQTSPDGSPLWVETHNAMSFTGSMAVDEPTSSLFISTCMRHPDLMIKIRSGGSEGLAVDFPEDLWSSRTRKSPSRARLEGMAWKITPPSDTLLDNAQHELSSGIPLQDCLDFVVLDSSDCDFEEALGKLAKICLDIHGVDDACRLYQRYTMSYAKEGELQVDDRGELMPISCAPEETWLMRMHLLGVVLPGREEEQRHFAQRFLGSS